MADPQNPSSKPRNAMAADAEAYRQSQRCGRAPIRVRTERAEMWVGGGRAHRALVLTDRSPGHSGREWWTKDGRSKRTMKELRGSFCGACNSRLSLEWATGFDVLRWHVGVVTGMFLPAEIAKMMLGALNLSRTSERGEEVGE